MGCAICKDKKIEPKEVFETNESIYDVMFVENIKLLEQRNQL